jgi:hypothetical protein
VTSNLFGKYYPRKEIDIKDFKLNARQGIVIRFN